MQTTRRLRTALGVLGLTVSAPWLLARWVMRRDDHLARFDEPAHATMKDPAEVGPEVDEVVELLRSSASSRSSTDRSERRRRVRAWLDELGARVEHDCEVVPVRTTACRGDWVVPPGADLSRRVLYLHGGAFEAGSPTSHRGITTRLAERTGMPLFVVDYRLAPEHTRQDALDDVDGAWELLCAQGPDGGGDLRAAFIAGDSAGGNLALGLSHRCRDGRVRTPDGVVAFSPMTDSTFASPSWHENIATDPFLGPGFAQFVELPREVLVLGLWAATRIRPDDPRVSPLLDDLSGLPPTLVQASASEMLRDDAVRYARAAQAAGSPVELQLWPEMVHVWQAFADLPEAHEALDEATAFLQRHATALDPDRHSPADTIA